MSVKLRSVVDKILTKLLAYDRFKHCTCTLNSKLIIFSLAPADKVHGSLYLFQDNEFTELFHFRGANVCIPLVDGHLRWSKLLYSYDTLSWTTIYFNIFLELLDSSLYVLSSWSEPQIPWMFLIRR